MCDFCENGKEVTSYNEIEDKCKIKCKKLCGNEIISSTTTHIGLNLSFCVENEGKIDFCPYCGKRVV